MGNSQAHVSVGEKTMYQVTQVTRLSPGAECGLQAGEDHLVAMNGRQLKGMSLESMMEIIKNSLNKPVELTVFNSKTQKTRTAFLLPSNDWPGDGLLGIKLKLMCVNCRSKSYQDLNKCVDFECKNKTNGKSLTTL